MNFSHDVSKTNGNSMMQTLPVQGNTIIDCFKTSGVRSVVALPDIVTCQNLLWPIYHDRTMDLIPVCKEDEGVSICAALSYANHRAVLLIQHTGFLDSINAIRAIAVNYQLPVIMFVGVQGMEAHLELHRSADIGIRSLPKICEAVELDIDVIQYESDAARIAKRIDSCYSDSKPHVTFLPQPPA